MMLATVYVQLHVEMSQTALGFWAGFGEPQWSLDDETKPDWNQWETNMSN